MKTIVVTVILACCVQGKLWAQEPVIHTKAFDVIPGIGIGHKGHYGNIGASANFYFSKSASLKFSAGIAALNYGGGILSVGPEVSIVNLNKGFLSVGSLWSYTGEGADILGDDDSDDYVWYESSYMRNLMGYIAYSHFSEGVIFKFEVGYRQALSDYSYTFSGPGEPTQKQHDRIQRGLQSGWLAAVSVNVLWRRKKET